LLRAFATAIWLIEKRTGKKWHEDRETALQVSGAIDEIIHWFAWRRRDPAMDAALLKYRDLSSLDSKKAEKLAKHIASEFNVEWADLPSVSGFEQSTAAANAAALETLQKMGMAPSDAEIDEAATKYRADPKYLEAKEIEIAKIIGEFPNAKEIAKIIGELPNAKEIAEIIGELPKTKDEGEGP
jgi:hypothetical protein